jgi:hypothetical protein
VSVFRPARLLFDINVCGKPSVDDIARLLADNNAQPNEIAEVIHVIDFQKRLGLGEEGVWDEKWVPQAAQDGWTIVASDRGKGGLSKGRKLPQLCLEHGATHVLLGAAVHKRKRFAKLITILSVWHELVEIASASPGARYMLEPSGQESSHRGRGKLAVRVPKAKPLKPFRPPEGEDENGTAGKTA